MILTTNQRTLVQLALAQRLSVRANPKDRRLRGVTVAPPGRTTNAMPSRRPNAPHPIAIAAAMELGLLTFGRQIETGCYRLDATAKAIALLQERSIPTVGVTC